MADTQNTTQRPPPSKGSYGICAPNSIAGDQRAMVNRPYATIAHSLASVQSGTTNFTPMRDNTATGSQATYVVGTAGIGDRGNDCGISDLLTRHETSFYAEGFPFRDYEFVLRGLSIMPEGKPFRAATIEAPNGSISIGGDMASGSSTGRPSIVEGTCSEIADSVVAAFFRSFSLTLGFKNESAKWDMGTPLFLPPGLGLVGSATPTNAAPIGGKTLSLPFEVVLPKANQRGTSVAQLAFVQERSVRVFASGPAARADYTFSNGVSVGSTPFFFGNSGNDSRVMVQLFKVVFVGERQCASDEAALARLAQLAQQLGCSMEVAQGLQQELSKSA